MRPWWPPIMDREHYHCHIVFNSVSFVDGKKYLSDFQSYFARCGVPQRREPGLWPVRHPAPRTGPKTLRPMGRGQRWGKATVTSLIRQDIDAAIQEGFTFDYLPGRPSAAGIFGKAGGRGEAYRRPPPGSPAVFRSWPAWGTAIQRRTSGRGWHPPGASG